MAIRVLLVDDHELVLDGLRALFAQDGEFEVVGEAGDARTAVELAAARRPHVIPEPSVRCDLSIQDKRKTKVAWFRRNEAGRQKGETATRAAPSDFPRWPGLPG